MPFDYLSAKKAGYSDKEIKDYLASVEKLKAQDLPVEPSMIQPDMLLPVMAGKETIGMLAKMPMTRPVTNVMVKQAMSELPRGLTQYERNQWEEWLPNYLSKTTLFDKLKDKASEQTGLLTNSIKGMFE